VALRVEQEITVNPTGSSWRDVIPLIVRQEEGVDARQEGTRKLELDLGSITY
jgi:hypothetical protein